MLNNLHITHSSDSQMILQAKNKIAWPNIKQETRLISIVSKPMFIVVVVVVIDVVFVKKNFRSKKILVEKYPCPKKLWGKKS